MTDNFYINEDGYYVMTAKFLERRGYCCGNGCLHCPYNYEKVQDIDLKIRLINKRLKKEKV